MNDLDHIAIIARYNNAGVRCFNAKRMTEAWDLFTAALEINKYVCGKGRQSSFVSASKEQDLPLPSVIRARAHLENIESIIANASTAEVIASTAEQPHRGTTPFVSDASGPSLIVNPLVIGEGRGGAPLEQPFDANSCSDSCNRYTSAIIIFNLGLVEQLRSRSSKQALSLYHLATALLSGGSDSQRGASANGRNDELGVALTNNVAVWYFDIGDFVASQKCIEHLLSVLEASSPILDKAVAERASFNVKMLLFSRFFCSPAA